MITAPPKYRLRAHRLGLIDPRWFNAKPWLAEPVAIDATGRTVTIKEVVLELQCGPLPPGTLVNVGLDRHFYCEKVADRECYRQEQQRQLEEGRARVQAKRAEIRRDAEAFNAALKLPFEWTPGMKMMLSGLTERSAGTGEFKKTVVHIMLDADISIGRLHRKQSEFLCSPSPENRRGLWREKAVWRDGDSSPYGAKVSCKRCLEIAKRLNQ